MLRKFGEQKENRGEQSSCRGERNGEKMLFRRSGRRRHPYATLAVFTIAGASMINLVNRAKSFVADKAEMVKKKFAMMKKK